MAETKRLPFLGRRRAKVKKSPTEWIETLVPVEDGQPEAPADLAGEAPLDAAPEAVPMARSAYVPPTERAPGLPDERTLESLRHAYVARSPMNLDQIHDYIDEHLASKRLPPPMRPRKAPPPVTEPRGRGRPIKIVSVPVAGDVVDQKIVYETAGGYVLEVTERGTNGRTNRSYYTISKVEHVAHALDALRSGGRLDTRPSVGAAAVPAPSFEEAKRALEEAPTPAPSVAERTPIEATRRVQPEPELSPVEPAAPAPEPTMAEFQEEAPPPAPEVPPQEEAKGRFGALAGRLKFRRKKGEAEPATPAVAAPAPPAEPVAEEPEKKGRFTRLFGKKKEEEAAVPAAAETTGTPTEPTAETEAAAEEGGRPSRFKKLRFGRKKAE